MSEQVQTQSGAYQPPKPAPRRSCEETTAEANKRLNQACRSKQFKINPVSPGAACSSPGCDEVRLPEMRPCFELRWGDGPRDQLETNDVEILCVSASNPYSNVVLKDVTIILSVLTQNGNPVPALPDGTPAVSLTPSEFICFGDLPACQGDNPGEVVREVVLASRGAKPGQYALSIEYCYSAEFVVQEQDQFTLELVAS